MLNSILYSLGIPGFMGSCGLIVGFQALALTGGGKIFVGVLTVIVGVGWGCAALADFYMLVRVSYYNEHILKCRLITV